MITSAQVKATTVIMATLSMLAALFSTSAKAQSPKLDTFDPGFVSYANTMALQHDGRILVGGSFELTRNGSLFYRLNPDGTLDPSFDPAPNREVNALLVQPDGKILVAGYFSSIAGTSGSCIVRLQADGSLDPTWRDPQVRGSLRSLALRSNGKILVGGYIESVNGQPASQLIQLNADGSLDDTLKLTVDQPFDCLALQADGKILIGGSFTQINGQSRTLIARFNSDGSLDPGFHPVITGPQIKCITVQPDGKILVGGYFSRVAGTLVLNLGRLNADGSGDPLFKPRANDFVFSLGLQADGSIILGGAFTVMNAQPRGCLAKIWPDGTLDSAFSLNADAFIKTMAVQPNGDVLISGPFTSVGGTRRPCLARLMRPGEWVDEVVEQKPSVIWRRGGNAPEVVRVTMETDSGGSLWSQPIPGTHAAGGWQFGNIEFTSGSSYRFRGFISGDSSSSGWFDEVYAGRPVVITPPGNAVGDAGALVRLSARVGGTEPRRYTWLKNEVALADGDGLLGVSTLSLTVSNLLGSSAGEYRLVVSNSFGVVTSAVAVVTVHDPAVVGDPQSVSRELGQNAVLEGTVMGTAPLIARWLKGGQPVHDGGRIAGASTSRLSISSLEVGDGGYYRLWVSNSFGNATSRVALLSVNQVIRDSQFNPAISKTPVAIAFQADGKILCASETMNPLGVSSRSLCRLNIDGSIDASFPLLSGPGVISALAVQPDGKILVAGSLSLDGGPTQYENLFRLNADGSPDGEFVVQIPSSPFQNGPVIQCIAVENDGKILVGGRFITVEGNPHGPLARLNSDGSADPSFDPIRQGEVYSIAVSVTGAIFANGLFSTSEEAARLRIARFAPDGAVEKDFETQPLAFGDRMLVEPDGRVICSTQIRDVSNLLRSYLVRLNKDGSMDPSFSIEVDRSIGAIVRQSDGRLLVGGWFTRIGGQERARIALLETDGSVNPGFNPGASGPVLAIALDGSGNMLLGGGNIEDWLPPSNFLVRYVNPTPHSDTFFETRSGLSWVRSGGVPDVTRAVFEVRSPDDGWMSLGEASRVGNEYRLASVLPTGPFTVRARGYAHDGSAGGSTWTVSKYLGWPTFDLQPSGSTNRTGGAARFAASALGSMPMSFQWLKNGRSLQDAPQSITGSQGPVLALTQIIGGDAGAYSLMISNAYGVSTSHVARLEVVDPIILAQPSSQTVQAGESATLTGVARGAAPMTVQWIKEGSPIPGATELTLTLPHSKGADAGSYQFVVMTPYGSATSQVASLSVNMALPDAGFVPLEIGPRLMPPLTVIAPQNDGGILAGVFLSYGVPSQQRQGLARFTHQGLLSPTFSSALNSEVKAIAGQPDGRTLIGGWFSKVAEKPIAYLGRLDTDGSPDLTFNPSPNSVVRGITLQTDEKILVAGEFTAVGAERRVGIVRLNPDGSVDQSFADPGASPNVDSVVVQADGKILVLGESLSINGLSRPFIARLNQDGTMDGHFHSEAAGPIRSIALQPDGKILLAGEFGQQQGQLQTRIARLNADGSLDGSFSVTADKPVYSIALQADGELLAGGDFTILAGLDRAHLGRLHNDGTADLNHCPAANGAIFSVILEGDGSALVGGSMTHISGSPVGQLGRLRNTTAPVERFEMDGSTLRWMRDGSAPELQRVRFDWSADGTNWAPLGLGTRIPRGWKTEEVPLPLRGNIRAVGFTSGGFYSACSWTVTSLMGKPLNESPSAESTRQAGSSVTMMFPFEGSSPMEFQWLKDGVELDPNRAVQGAIPGLLTLNTLLGEDSGLYQAVAKNAYGSATSAVHSLTVLDPAITSAQESTNVDIGAPVLLEQRVAGTPPLQYRWYRNGVLIDEGADTQATAVSRLTIPAAGLEAIGKYTFSVHSRFGSVTSAPAYLGVNAHPIDPYFKVEMADRIDSATPLEDGKILVGGSFPARKGVPAYSLARLNRDGSLDESFLRSGPAQVNTISALTDGNYLVGGQFSFIGGGAHANMALLKVDGLLNPKYLSFTEPNGVVNVTADQGGGAYIVGGAFTSISQTSHARLAMFQYHRQSFWPLVFQAKVPVSSFLFRADENVLIGVRLGEVNANGLSSLTYGGVPDTLFKAVSADAPVSCLALQADGKMLVGGDFSTVGGFPRHYLARINSNGSVDTSFNIALDGPVTSLAVQCDGLILLSGAFSNVSNQPRRGIARLSQEGALDATLCPADLPFPLNTALQHDGGILAAGTTTGPDGIRRGLLVRLSPPAPAIDRLSVEGGVALWVRAGGGPEIWRALLETTQDGTNWNSLGYGRRTAQGWQFTHPGIPSSSILRARGLVQGGLRGAASWYVESLWSRGPQLLGPVQVGNANIRFSISTVPNASYRLETSSNLINWIEVFRATNSTSTSPVILPLDGSSTYRFYRAREQ